jgi:hypothetical protein
MAVKLDLPGSTLTWGYESEQADRGVRKALVTDEPTKESAINAAVNAAQSGGENLYSTNNIPLQSATAIRLGVNRWLVDLNYARGRLSQRREASERYVSVTTLSDILTPVYLTTQNRLNGLPYDTITSPDYQYWYRMPYAQGTANTVYGQDAATPPEPYMFRKPQLRITINYTSAIYTFGNGEVAKVGKSNQNVFPIAEIGAIGANAFAQGELFYEGFDTDPRDISRFSAAIRFRYTPGGFYNQRLKWNNGATYPNDRYWYVANEASYELITF